MNNKQTNLAAISDLKNPVQEPPDLKLNLKRALFFYESNSDSVAVLFNYKDKELTEPRPLSRAEMSGFLPKEDKLHVVSVLPPRALSQKPICWWVPAKRRNISVRRKPMKTFAYPPLVFKLAGGRLYLARLPENEHPEASTELLMPPFGGIDVHGSVMGACAVKAPKRQTIQDIPEWENAFFLSAFNFPPKRDKPQPLGVTLEQWIK